MIVIVGISILSQKNNEVERFKIHELCNRCVYITVSTDTTFRMKTNKVMVEIWKQSKEDQLDSWVLVRRKKLGKEVAKWVSREG